METYTIILDNLAFPQDAKGELHWTGTIRGFGKGDIRSAPIVNSGANGGMIPDQFIDMRRIPLDLVVHSPDLHLVESLALQVNQVLEINKVIEVRLITPTGKQYGLKARVLMAEPEIGDIVSLIDYRVELLAEDPIIYDYTDGSGVHINLQKAIPGGVPWEVDGIDWNSEGFDWEDGQGDAEVHNLGTAAVAPVIKISGATTNPIFTNKTTNQVISLNITTTVGDEIIIDCSGDGTVTLNGQNIYNNLISDDFWNVIPGLNIISYTSNSESDTATIDFGWLNGHMGIM